MRRYQTEMVELDGKKFEVPLLGKPTYTGPLSASEKPEDKPDYKNPFSAHTEWKFGKMKPKVDEQISMPGENLGPVNCRGVGTGTGCDVGFHLNMYWWGKHRSSEDYKRWREGSSQKTW